MNLKNFWNKCKGRIKAVIKHQPTPEQAARYLLYERERIAESEKRIEACMEILQGHFDDTKSEEAIIVGNTKVYPTKRVKFDFGEDKDDKRKKAFTKSLTGHYYYKVPNYSKIAKALEADEPDAKITALIEKHKPTINKRTVIKVKHVHPTVDV